MSIRYSIQPSVIGKASPHLLGRGWETREGTRADFVREHFIEGRAIAAGVFSTDHRRDADWQGSELVVIDIDHYPEDATVWTLERVWADPFISQFAFASFPSSRFDHSEPKLHVYFQLSEWVDDLDRYRAICKYVQGMIAIPSDPALGKPSQAVFGTVFQRINAEKSFDSPLLHFNPDAPSVDVGDIEVTTDVLWDSAEVPDRLLPEGHGALSAEVSWRAREHVNYGPDQQLAVTLEALEWALRGWGRRSHDDWKALLMSAFAGSPDVAVARAIASSTEVDWQDGEQAAVLAWWAKHKPRAERGYTVATLFLMARLNGWLQHTSADLTESDTVPFTAEEVGDFLVSTLPRRALVLSATGTGKTLGAIKMLKYLGTPRAVFFAPSIKLCMALSATLTAAGVENTLYIEGNTTKDADTLQQAHVLVTTLQTFGTKIVQRGVNMADYKMAVIDEVDELVSSFVLSGTRGTLRLASHVSRQQARFGIIALEAIFKEVQHVLMLDGTATRVSLEMARAFSSVPVTVYRNTFHREKAFVQMVKTLDEARGTFLDAIQRGERGVYIADTRRECLQMEQLLLLSGAAGADEVITLTSRDVGSDKVLDFFADVEEGARQYRAVIYNSAMGSGVSIVETQPDVIVQVAAYVSPRKNIQMLNRYRRQPADGVYCYVPMTEQLYNETYSDTLDRIAALNASEFAFFGLEPVHGDRRAGIVADLALLAATDHREQRRSPRVFYTELLREDGREVIDTTAQAVDKDLIKAARDAYRQQAEEIKAGWRDVEPFDRQNPPPAGLDPLDVAKGLLHAKIKRVVPNYDTLPEDDYTIADRVIRYAPHLWTLRQLVSPQVVTEAALADMADDVPETARNFYLSRLDLLGQVGCVLPDTDAVMGHDAAVAAAPVLRRALGQREAVYNTVASRRNCYKAVVSRYADDPARETLTFLKEMIKATGLKLVQKAGPRRDDGTRERVTHFANADEVLAFLSWAGVEVDGRLHFDATSADGLFEYSRKTGKQLQAIPVSARNDVLRDGIFEL